MEQRKAAVTSTEEKQPAYWQIAEPDKIDSKE